MPMYVETTSGPGSTGKSSPSDQQAEGTRSLRARPMRRTSSRRVAATAIFASGNATARQVIEAGAVGESLRHRRILCCCCVPQARLPRRARRRYPA